MLELVDGAPVQQDVRTPVFAAIDQAARTQLAVKRLGQAGSLVVELAPEEYAVEVMPHGSMRFDDIGYIELPQHIAYTRVTEDYATEAQKVIRGLDEGGACGWIVDLRQSLDGNMWPMMAAIGPILGEETLGWFVFENGNKSLWAYQDGKALLNHEVVAQASPSYSLKMASPPVAVLTGPLRAGAGEAVTIAFRGREDTRSFGEPTNGLPTATSGQELSDGASIFLSVAWQADRRGNIYKDRIPPDEIVEIDWTLLGSESDPVLQAAADWLHTQTDCSP